MSKNPFNLLKLPHKKKIIKWKVDKVGLRQTDNDSEIEQRNENGKKKIDGKKNRDGYLRENEMEAPTVQKIAYHLCV